MGRRLNTVVTFCRGRLGRGLLAGGPTCSAGAEARWPSEGGFRVSRRKLTGTAVDRGILGIGLIDLVVELSRIPIRGSSRCRGSWLA